MIIVTYYLTYFLIILFELYKIEYDCLPYIPYPGTTRVVNPITAVLRISTYACSWVMTSPSEHIVITLASL